MADFLSAVWVAELDATLRSSSLRAGDAADAPLVYEFQAHTPDRSTRTHHVTIDADGVRATFGPAPSADLVLITDIETALALHHNDLNAQAAIAAGSLRIRGDLEAFSRHAAAITALGDVFGALRAATTAGIGRADDGR